MEVYFPEYYHRFRCIAGACPDSCCKEWAVDVDPDAAAFYRNLPGDLGDELRAVLRDTDNGTIMTIRDGRCPMWRQDGLCKIQAQLGHDALCKTCREFPRLRHDYGNFVELGLELSCPEAAKLILKSNNDALLCQVQPGGETPEYDPEIMDILRASRAEMLDFLESRAYSLPEILAIILLHSHSLQAQLDGAEATPLDPDSCLNESKKYAAKGDINAIFSFYAELEILTDAWRDQLQKKPNSICWSDELRALVRYGIQRYWLQTVSDYDLICRVKLILSACLLVGAMGGDPVETAQLYSKEIENDPDNVEAILDGVYTSPALTDANLLGLLLAQSVL